MINKNNVIECYDYEQIVNYIYDDSNLETEPPSGSVYVATELFKEFITRFGNNNKKYIIFSGASDYGIEPHTPETIPNLMAPSMWLSQHMWKVDPLQLGLKGIEQPSRCIVENCNLNDKFCAKIVYHVRYTFNEIPNNIIWYVANNLINEPNVHYLPYGILRGSRNTLHEYMTKADFSKKQNKIYVNIQCSNEYRAHLKRYMKTISHYDNRIVFSETKSYSEYLEDLLKYKYVFSPPGNGWDCARFYECLYMQSIPIVFDSPLIRKMNFPMVVCPSDMINNIFCEANYYDWDKILNTDGSNINWDIPELSVDFWRKKCELT